MNQCGTNAGYYRHYRRGQRACRPCLDAHATAVIRTTVPVRTRKMSKWREYGMDAEAAWEFWESHPKICDICGGIANTVDHDHELEPMAPPRGILCGHCNKGLGFFRDNLTLLQQAIVYLNH